MISQACSHLHNGNKKCVCGGGCWGVGGRCGGNRKNGHVREIRNLKNTLLLRVVHV